MEEEEEWDLNRFSPKGGCNRLKGPAWYLYIRKRKGGKRK